MLAKMTIRRPIADLTPGEVLATIEKPVELEEAERHLEDLRTRHADLASRYREVAGAAANAGAVEDGRQWVAELRAIGAERELLQPQIVAARHARDALKLPYGDAVAARMQPVGEAAAARIIAAATELRDALRTLEEVADINARSLLMRIGTEQVSSQIGTAVTALPTINLTDVDRLVMFCRRVQGEEIIF